MLFRNKKKVNRLEQELGNLSLEKSIADDNIYTLEKQFEKLSKVLEKTHFDQNKKIIKVFDYNGDKYYIERAYTRIDVDIIIYNLDTKEKAGILNFEIKNKIMEIVIIDSFVKGLGSILLDLVNEIATDEKVIKVWGEIWEKDKEELFYFYRKNGYIVDERKMLFYKK